MSDMTSSSQQDPMGRVGHFGAGATGSLGGVSPGTALPAATQAQPDFSAIDDLNAIPNTVPTANGKSQTTYRNDMFPVMAKSSPLEQGEQQEQQQPQQGARQ